MIDGFVIGVTLRHLGLGYSALLKRSVLASGLCALQSKALLLASR